MPESLLGSESLVRVVGTQLCDEVNTLLAGMFHECPNALSILTWEVELHVSRLTA